MLDRERSRANPLKTKVWDATTGVLTKRFSSITEADATAFYLDPAGRRMLLGDHKGNIKVCNTITGGTLVDIKKAHDNEVRMVSWC